MITRRFTTGPIYHFLPYLPTGRDFPVNAIHCARCGILNRRLRLADDFAVAHTSI